MTAVTFIPFPNPNKELDECRRLVRACGRENFDVEKVTKDTLICTLHFVGGNGPSEHHPDPIPASFTPIQIQHYSSKRKPPKERDIYIVSWKQLKLDTQGVAEALIDLACSPGLPLIYIDFPRQQDTIPRMMISHDSDSACDSVIVSEVSCTQDVGCQTVISKEAQDINVRLCDKFLQNENKLLKSELNLLKSASNSCASKKK